MNTCASNMKFLLGLLSAHILLYVTYQNTGVFWYLYTAAILVCIAFSITIEKTNMEQQPFFLNTFYGILGGAALFGIVLLGNFLINALNLNGLERDIAQIFKKLSPVMAWHYLVLFIFIIPGEELFWRGFVQKKLMTYFKPAVTICLSAILYALPMLYAANTALLLAGLAGGLIWGALYQWKQSLSLVIISHLVFDILMLGVFPLI